jgi:hypothetical protein
MVSRVGKTSAKSREQVTQQWQTASTCRKRLGEHLF